MVGSFLQATTQKNYIVVTIEYFSKWMEGRFKEFCDNLHISLVHSSITTPKTNSQAEAINEKILQGLKKKVEDAKGIWLDKLLGILWSLQTTSHSGTEETPFNLMFDTEVVIPTEINLHTHQMIHYADQTNETKLKENLDFFEVKDRASIQMAI
ncbi:uncharacterized protein [Gossypium hirsutum]|uniref:Integrase catalytic domain-containing protein n=1 Tax=Gossypium hirsutum TaxID=3635 RepID=A0A1U8KHD8_GOSHI|nr:uncharacterized protein LOC107915483 [Gossypium hirsutum]